MQPLGNKPTNHNLHGDWCSICHPPIKNGKEKDRVISKEEITKEIKDIEDGLKYRIPTS